MTVNRKTNLPYFHAPKYIPSFASTPLYELAVIRKDENGQNTRIPAMFSKLEPENFDDYKTMLKMRFQLGEGDVCGNYICENFISHPPKSFNYFAVETQEKNIPLKDRILCIAEVEISDSPQSLTHKMEINYLQSLHASSSAKFKDLKGGGELCLYGLTKIAREKNLDYIHLRSEKNDFYDHIQFGEKDIRANNSTYYVIKNGSFDNFLKRVEEKYNL